MRLTVLEGCKGGTVIVYGIGLAFSDVLGVLGWRGSNMMDYIWEEKVNGSIQDRGRIYQFHILGTFCP
jgi:hypothetical protein